MSTHTRALIDSATLQDAFAALDAGKGDQWNPWMARNLVDTTWLLLFDNVSIVPGPKMSSASAAPGHEAKLVTRIPELLLRVSSSPRALSSMKRWLSSPSRPLHNAWDATRNRREFAEWASHQRERGWPLHFAANESLFRLEDLSWLCDLLNVSRDTLMEAQRQSTSASNVKGWSKGKGGDVAELAGQAFLASTLARGKYHEYFARANDLTLIAHPIRDSITSRTSKQQPLRAANSENRFVEILIGSALLERTPRGRIDLWTENILRARLAIQSRAIALPDTVLPSDADDHAFTAARKISIAGAAKWKRDVLNFCVSANISALGTVLLGPWGAVAGLSLVAYKIARGKTLGETLALSATTDRNFRRIGNSVSGKLFRPG